MSITAKELATQLGISAAAVSMALNDKPGVSESTRAAVIEAAKNGGYDFGKLKSPSSERGKFVFLIYKKHGAVVADTPFFSEVTEGITRACKSRGYSLDINYLFESEVADLEVRRIFASNIDGAILLATEMREPDFALFRSLPVPFVVLDTYFEGIDKDCVLINNVQGAYLAAKYLITQRRGQPGYLRSSYTIGNFDERADGFYKAIRENGMSASHSIVHRLTPSIEGAYADMTALLNQGVETAKCYFGDNDLITIGAMRAFKEHGFKIPDDVGFVGFDNTILCELTEPHLSTINVPKQSMGRLAVDRLISITRNGSSEKTKTEIMTSLIKRDSMP